ncbi:MAG: glutamyl-tRNA reductase [Ignavibacteriales bacterium]
MYILLAGVSHRTAPVEIREKLALNGSTLDKVYEELKSRSALEGVVILSTCNRTEIYATVRNIDEGNQTLRSFIADYLQVKDTELNSILYTPNCYDAISHLFRVASGLDSMVLGETQILGQVRDAYTDAVERGASDGVLNALFQRAIYVGKKVRTETELDRHAVSISYAAVEKAKQVFGSLEGCSVLVIGAGKMSELAVKYLVSNGVSSVLIASRSLDRASCLAGNVGGQAIGFQDLADKIGQADIVISATAASHYILHRSNMMPHLDKRQKPILLIDIAVPRDIDPALGEINGVHLYDIDDLQNVIDINLSERQRAARQAEKIITDEINEFNTWLSTLYVIPVITALKSMGEGIREAEIQRALNKLGKVSARDEKIIRAMASSIVNQLLHFPVVNLKEVAVTNQGHLYAEIIKKLFQLEVETEESMGYVESESGV